MTAPRLGGEGCVAGDRNVVRGWTEIVLQLVEGVEVERILQLPILIVLLIMNSLRRDEDIYPLLLL